MQNLKPKLDFQLNALCYRVSLNLKKNPFFKWKKSHCIVKRDYKWQMISWWTFLHRSNIFETPSPVGKFCGHVVYRYFPILVRCTNKNLATPARDTPAKSLVFLYLLNRVARWYICIPKMVQFRYIFEDLGMEKDGIFYGRLVYFTSSWYSLRAVCILCCHLVCIIHILVHCNN
jgi:hypothetical protein